MLINYMGQAGADCQHAVQQRDKDLLEAAVIKLLNVEEVAIPVVEMIVPEGKPPGGLPVGAIRSTRSAGLVHRASLDPVKGDASTVWLAE